MWNEPQLHVHRRDGGDGGVGSDGEVRKKRTEHPWSSWRRRRMKYSGRGEERNPRKSIKEL